MNRELIPYAVFIAALIVMFNYGGTDWRSYQRDYRRSSFQRSQQAWQRSTAHLPAAIPADSLLERLEALGMDGRLESLADSLSSVRADLGRYRDLLLAARDVLNKMEVEADEEGVNEYFSAVRTYRRIDGATDALEAELDSMSEGLSAVESLAGRREVGGVADLRWITPSRVPVREACTTCHLPLESGARVMLYPDDGREVKYPDVMARHDPRQFGCTACHAGVAGSLDFRDAHGPDHHLRPFRPGKLAIRGCGICHAERSPMAGDAVAFSWPEACANCHRADTPAALIDSTDNPVLDVPVREIDLRAWLMRHWAVKTGAVPRREEFESALVMLVSGDVRRVADEDSLQTPASDEQDHVRTGGITKAEFAVCPRCGRSYELSMEHRQVYCPVDGALLTPAGNGK